MERNMAFKPQSSVKTKPYTLWGELIFEELCNGILFFLGSWFPSNFLGTFWHSHNNDRDVTLVATFY